MWLSCLPEQLYQFILPLAAYKISHFMMFSKKHEQLKLPSWWQSNYLPESGPVCKRIKVPSCCFPQKKKLDLHPSVSKKQSVHDHRLSISFITSNCWASPGRTVKSSHIFNNLHSQRKHGGHWPLCVLTQMTLASLIHVNLCVTLTIHTSFDYFQNDKFSSPRIIWSTSLYAPPN